MNSSLSQLASIADRAASAARNATPTLVCEKSAHDFVTDMDRKLQAEISAALSQNFPGVPCFGEEGIAADQKLPQKSFLIDPLDGTSNWIAGLPFCAVSIAYLEDGESVMAVVASIAGGGVYAAELGKGAWLDGDRMQLDGPPAALIGLSTGILDAVVSSEIYRALRRYGKVRNLGSQALQLCAVGRGSLAINASREACLWDDAAGSLIATEAGARYSATVASEDAGRPAARQQSICAHPDLFDDVVTLLKPIFETSEI